MPLVWSLGSVVGPSFGGFFAEPAKQWPSVFGQMEYFKRYPYSLPNLVAAIFFLISVVIAALFLKETLPGKKEERDWGLLVGKRITRAFKKRPAIHHRRSSMMDGEATAPLLPSKFAGKRNITPPSTKEVFTSQTVINLVAYTFLAFHSVAYDQNLPVLLNYPKITETKQSTHLPFYFTGGFGLESGEIGTIFTCYGVACGLIQFLIYPALVTKFGVLRCFRICCEPLSPNFKCQLTSCSSYTPLHLLPHTIHCPPRGLRRTIHRTRSLNARQRLWYHHCLSVHHYSAHKLVHICPRPRHSQRFRHGFQWNWTWCWTLAYWVGVHVGR